jgi:hypothetical protein
VLGRFVIHTVSVHHRTPMAEFNRDQIISDYVDRILDNMSTKDLMRIVGDQLEENFNSYSDEELIAEVTEYYPELMEN